MVGYVLFILSFLKNINLIIIILFFNTIVTVKNIK